MTTGPEISAAIAREKARAVRSAIRDLLNALSVLEVGDTAAFDEWLSTAKNSIDLAR